jgi:uncharacterized protein
MPNDILFWFFAGLAALVVGGSKGGVPGIGILGVPVLSQVISPVVAAGLLLPIFILSDLYGLWLYRKSYDTRNIIIIVAAATIGIAVGWATAQYNSDALVKFLVGSIGLWYAADLYFKSRRKVPAEARPADIPRGIFWGSLAGFTSFVAHAGGTPYQMFVLPQKLDKMTYAGTTTIAFSVINLLKLPPYWQLGQVNVGSLWTAAYLVPVALFGAWGGYKLTKLLPQKMFFRCVEIALFLVSLKLIFDAFKHWMN